MHMKIEEPVDRLRKSGYKVTPQRLAIYEWVLSRTDHPTAEQVHREMLRKYPTISLATIYQALHLLTSLGLLHELGFADRSSRFDPNVSPHVNVICQKCGEIRDLETKSVNALWSQIVEEVGFKPVGQRLDLYWNCDRCSGAKDRNERT